MTIASATNRVTYTGNGAVDTYAYTFRIFDDDDLTITVRDTATIPVETTLVKTTDYTVTGVGSLNGGNVVLVNSGQAWLDGDGDLKSGYTLVIRRVRDIIQETDIRNQGDFYPESHEDAFDHFIMVDQQQQDEIERSIKLPETDAIASFNVDLPTDLIGSVNKTLMTNDAGNGWETGPSAGEIENAEAYAESAKDWAMKTDGIVESTDFSAKAWAIGGTDVTDTASRGAAKEWAIETSGTVDGNDYSSKEYAQGTQASTGGSAKAWASKTDGIVDSIDYSSKEWAQGIQNRGAASGGSSKDWAIYTGGTVDDSEYSSKYYADLAADQIQGALGIDVLSKVFADSPITLTSSDRGKVVNCDCSGGNIVVNLPSIAALDLTTPFGLIIKKTDSSGNTVTINRDGTDTLDGDASATLSKKYDGVLLFAENSTTPDKWAVSRFGDPSSASAAGIDSMYNVILGDASDVSSGKATHTQLSDVTLANGDRILILPTYADVENWTINKQVTVHGVGVTSVIQGTITLTTDADYSLIERVKVTDNITLNSGADGIVISNIWFATSKTFIDNGSGNYLMAIQQ